MRKILFTVLVLSFSLPAQIAFATLAPPPSNPASGSQTFSTPGTYTFTVPAYSALTVTVNGAGGGGGGGSLGGCYPRGGIGGATGGSSAFDTVIAYGGGSGGVGHLIIHRNRTQCGSYGTPGSDGAPGTTNNTGDINVAGGGASGGAGGWGTAPGGNGGSGGEAIKNYASGALVPGSISQVTVGAGGTGGARAVAGNAGSDGSIVINWTASPPPTCSITLDQNPIPYGSGTTLRWSSANADISFYINNVGYVNSPGSTIVEPSATTDYSGTVVGSGGSATCPASLGVTPPPDPTATISADSPNMYVGQSTGVHATFAVGSGDSLTGDNIDSPLGTGLGATTNPDASKGITFTPASPGTYTFYARATTGYFTSWATYAMVSVTVSAPPSCTPSYTCQGQTIQYTNDQCQVSNTATCAPPSFCSAGSSACLTPPPPGDRAFGSHSGHLEAHPSLIGEGFPVTLFWNVANVQANTCEVKSVSNTDDWKGMASSGQSGIPTSPIRQQTIYTLTCTGLDGSAFTENATVNIIPKFREQ